MKKNYISPNCKLVELHAYTILAGSAQGSVNGDSMTKEDTESMSRRSGSFWDDDMD